MAGKKPDEDALVVFSKGQTQGLPAAVQKALERWGVKTKERSGIAPTWKPLDPGSYILGEIVAVKHNVGEFNSDLLTLDTPNDGFQTVWLGTELRQKFPDIDDVVGKTFCIVYEGVLAKKDNPKLKNDMKLFKVVELIPPEK